MRSPENVLESLKSKACNKSYKYERLYRNLYNPQFYLLAYQRIQAKPGNMTAGTDGKTIDGMGMARINALIEKMRDFSYQPNPARRTYIPKSNGKMRPLGILSFDDKLIQEVVRLILESIYEPTFSDYSHGFRINKSCHTALKYVQKYFTGTKWFVEGDIKGCFDNVDHHVLIDILRKRIADEHFIGLLWKFLKAGYMEDWNYHNTYSGTPQGSIISPILANIYMNELDNYMAEYAEKFNCGNRRKINPAFKKKLDVCRGKEQRLKRNLSKMSEKEKEGLIAEIRELRRSLKSMPYSDQMDDSYKRICYVRYADDFLIGVIGSKEDAEQVKQEVGCFIREKLHLEMSGEKTLITHGHDFAKFLGYEVTIAKGEYSKKTKTGATRRVNNGKVLLYVPHDKWVKRLLSLLWSSFFVTLVAKKIVLINLCCRPCFIWGSITIITVWTNMIIINVCKFFYLLIECFLCCKLIQICAFILQGIEITLHRCIVVRISCFAHALCHIYRFAEFGKCFGRIL